MPVPRFVPSEKKGPEAKEQEKWLEFLRAREWFVKATHGNMYQSGYPDLYCAHRRYRQRWIEIKMKNRLGSFDIFTPAQLETFPQMSAVDVGIWVLTDCCESEYAKLWQPPNWQTYLAVLRPTGRDYTKTRS